MESVKPDYSLSLKRQWFAKIWNGEKTVEYRKVGPRYRRFDQWIGKCRGIFFMLYIGMMPTGPRLLVAVKEISIGKCQIEGFDGDYYAISFEVVQAYMFDHGTYMPMMEMPRMKELPG